MTNTKEKLISIKEASAWTGIAEKTFRKWQQQRKISHTKIHGAVRLYQWEIQKMIEDGHKNKLQ